MKRSKSKRTGLRIDSGLHAVSFSAEVRFHGSNSKQPSRFQNKQLVAMQLLNDPSNSAVTPYNSHFRKCVSKTELPEHAKIRKNWPSR